MEHKNGNYKIFSNMQQHQQMLDPIKENMSLIKFNNFAAHTRSHLQNIKKTFLIKWREKLEKFFIMEFRYVALIDFICLASHNDLKCAVEFPSDSFVLHVILLFDFSPLPLPSFYIPKYLTSHTPNASSVTQQIFTRFLVLSFKHSFSSV